jgi:hypothetical protein
MAQDALRSVHPFSFVGWVKGDGDMRFDFLGFWCSHHVPQKFPMMFLTYSNLFPKMFPIAL